MGGWKGEGEGGLTKLPNLLRFIIDYYLQKRKKRGGERRNPPARKRKRRDNRVLN